MIEILQIGSYIATILGIPIAILLFYNEKIKERKDREYGTYNALDDKFLEYLKLCLENPNLDVFDVSAKEPSALSPTDKRKELVIFSFLISIFERAYLMYKDQPTKLRKAQFIGWNEYIEKYFKRKNFREAWEKVGDTWDTDFTTHMNDIFSKTVETKT